MGLFSSISDAFNSVADAIENAYDAFSEKIHDIFYTPTDYISEDITVKPTKDSTYDTWLIEQNALDFGVWTDYADVFAEGGTP